MSNESCIYVTGLPGAGKTTVGRYIAKLLAIPILDKDDYLEALFETRGVGDMAWRHKLSREADVIFQREARSINRTVLVSHWRPKGALADYGTPCEWLTATYKTVIEVHCDCPIGVAASRFTNRVRHKGHADETRSSAEIEAWLNDYADHLPIGLGARFVVSSVSRTWQDEIKNAFQEHV